MDLIRNYDIYFSTCSSSLIQIQPTKNQNVIKRDSIPKQEITSLSWGRQQNEIVLGYKDGTLTIYDSNTETFREYARNEKKIVSIFPYENEIVYATQNGHVYFKGERIVQNGDETKTLQVARANEFDPNVFGYGGVENDLKLYDITTGKSTFTAKGDKHDELNLRRPISISDMVFLDPTRGVNVATVTLYGQIRMYDVRTQRRPVKTFENPKDATRTYTKIAKMNDTNQIVVGTNKGCIQSFDFRKDVKPLKARQAYMGAVVDLLCLDDRIVSCGMDRYWKVHNVENLIETRREYMKTQLTAVIARPKSTITSDCSSESEPEPVKRRKTSNS